MPDHSVLRDSTFQGRLQKTIRQISQSKMTKMQVTFFSVAIRSKGRTTNRLDQHLPKTMLLQPSLASGKHQSLKEHNAKTPSRRQLKHKSLMAQQLPKITQKANSHRHITIASFQATSPKPYSALGCSPTGRISHLPSPRCDRHPYSVVGLEGEMQRRLSRTYNLPASSLSPPHRHTRTTLRGRGLGGTVSCATTARKGRPAPAQRPCCGWGGGGREAPAPGAPTSAVPALRAAAAAAPHLRRRLGSGGGRSGPVRPDPAVRGAVNPPTTAEAAAAAVLATAVPRGAARGCTRPVRGGAAGTGPGQPPPHRATPLRPCRRQREGCGGSRLTSARALLRNARTAPGLAPRPAPAAPDANRLAERAPPPSRGCGRAFASCGLPPSLERARL